MVTVTTSVIGSSLPAEEAMAVVVVLRLQSIGAPKAENEAKKKQAISVNFMLMLMEIRNNSWVEKRKGWVTNSFTERAG